MALLFTAIPSAIKFKAMGTASSSGDTSITGVQESFAWNEDDPTVNEIKDQFSQFALYQTATAGSISFTFDIAGIDLDVLAELTGGTYDGVTTNTYTAPTTYSTKYFKWLLTFGDGAKAILVSKGMTTVKLQGDDLKNAPMKATVTVTLAIDNSSGTPVAPYTIYEDAAPTSW